MLHIARAIMSSRCLRGGHILKTIIKHSLVQSDFGVFCIVSSVARSLTFLHAKRDKSDVRPAQALLDHCRWPRAICTDAEMKHRGWQLEGFQIAQHVMWHAENVSASKLAANSLTSMNVVIRTAGCVSFTHAAAAGAQ